MSRTNNGQIQECVKTWQNYALFISSTINCVKSASTFLCVHLFKNYRNLHHAPLPPSFGHLQGSIIFGDVRVTDFTKKNYY